MTRTPIPARKPGCRFAHKVNRGGSAQAAQEVSPRDSREAVISTTRNKGYEKNRVREVIRETRKK
jgi:hypothetical protein